MKDKAPIKGDFWKIMVYGCARCGQDHLNIEFRAMERPVVDPNGIVWTMWAPCPTTGDPILMRVLGVVASDGDDNATDTD